MLGTRKQWLRDRAWDRVAEQNRALCQTAEIGLQLGRNYHTACTLWEKTVQQHLTLAQALDIFRQCHDLAPFRFYNTPTFAVLARELASEVAEGLPAVEGEILRNTLEHYAVGTISRNELVTVCRSFESDKAPRKASFWRRFFTSSKQSGSKSKGDSPDPLASSR
jgi:hypothetical protein